MRKLGNLTAFASIGMLLLATSCSKQPVAIIEADKTEVEVGEVVTFSNTTIDGATYY